MKDFVNPDRDIKVQELMKMADAAEKRHEKDPRLLFMGTFSEVSESAGLK